MVRSNCNRLHSSRYVQLFCRRNCFRALVTLLMLLTTSCTLMSARLGYDFEVASFDSRVLYEPGAEDMLTDISPLIEQIENAQFVKFKNESKLTIYNFNDKTRYSKYSNTHPSAFGSSSSNDAYISAPRLRERPETIEDLLLHELSHIHLRQYVGSWRYVVDIPQWFHEGLATSVSGGAGAALVSAEEARDSILSGKALVPKDTGSYFNPETAWFFKLRTDMFYRQSQMFVEYLIKQNPTAFEKTLEALVAGAEFRNLWASNYGSTVSDLWVDFKNSL